MDPARSEFLFGVVDPGLDVDDEDEVNAFFAAELRSTSDDPVDDDDRMDPRALIRTVLAQQILHDQPPEVWQTVQRLRGDGLERDEILEQMVLVLGHEIELALAPDDEDNDLADDESDHHYRSMLEQLPAPSASDIAATVESVVAGTQGVTLTSVREEVLERLERPAEELGRIFVDAVIDQGIMRGALGILAGDRLVFPRTLTDGTVATHRLHESEVAHDVLSCIGNDLAAFAWRDDLSAGAGDENRVEVFSLGAGDFGWQGPEGWLREFAADDLIAVRVDADGALRIERLDDDLAPDRALVERLRQVYEADIAGTRLPSLCTDLVFALLVDDPSSFAQPRMPLRELLQHAGLELRGGFVAHDEELWRVDARLRRVARVHDTYDDPDLVRDVLAALDVADHEDAAADELTETLDSLEDPEVCWGVLDELVDPDDAEQDRIAAATAFAQRLVGAAQKPSDRMLAHFVSAIVAERTGDVLVAEAHLHLALEADPEWGPLIDRAAWYASDRGDASRAVSLWRTLEGPDREELQIVEACARRVGPKRGRNDPCWCGSGRKLKVCHAGEAEPIPLPDRVLWLATKAVGNLMRHGGEAALDLADLAMILAVDVDDVDDARSMLGDPIVIDLALTELGWFEQFLEARGPLLPDDEALLATSWLLVDRTVYEIEATRPGDGVVVRDLRTGEHLDVRERTMSAQATVGQMVCARALPDSVTNQFVGSVFHVPPGREREVLELCDNGDAFALCKYVAALRRPPRFATSENEPLVSCTVVARVRDPSGARRVLDDAYESDDDGWTEMHELPENERLVRAQLTLDGDTLTVSTQSEQRVERVLALLRAAIPDLDIVSDERVPLRPGAADARSDPAHPVELDPAIREEIVDAMEQRWLRESVPALGGVTPIEAAADPTRREELERLLASFPEPTEGPAMTLRPWRLRALLGLSEP